MNCHRRINLIGLNLLLFVLASTLSSQTLQPNQELKRILKNGEVHNYYFSLNTGEYLHVEVEQRGIDVVLTLANTEGSVNIVRDRPNGANGMEVLSFISPKKGVYSLEIKTLEKGVPDGEYYIKSSYPRAANFLDKKRIKAETLSEEGNGLIREKTVEAITIASEKFQVATVLWLALSDVYAEALAQVGLAGCKVALGKVNDGINAYRRALKLYKQLNNLHDVAEIQSIVGRLYLDSGRYQEALKCYKDAVLSWNELGEQWRAGDMSWSEGHAYFYLKQYPESIISYNRAVLIWEKFGAKFERARTLHDIGVAYSFTGDERAITYLRQALDDTPAEDIEGIATTLRDLSNVYSARGDNEKGIYYLEQLLSLWRRLSYRKGEIEIYIAISDIYKKTGQFGTALKYLKNALEVSKAISDKKNEAQILHLIGHVYIDSGDRKTALRFLSESSSLSESISDNTGLTERLNEIGAIYGESEGDYDNAFNYFNRALSLAKKNKDLSAEAQCYYNIGNSYTSRYDFKAAMEQFTKALSIGRQLKNQAIEAEALHSIGGIYGSLNDDKNANLYYDQALKGYQQLKNLDGEGGVLLSISFLLKGRKQNREIMENCNKALLIFQKTGNKMNEAEVISLIGSTYSDMGDKEKALEFYQKSLTIDRANGYKLLETQDLQRAGLVYEDLGKKETALDYYYRSLILAGLTNYRYVEIAVFNNIMTIKGDSGKLRAASFFGKQSVNVIQQIRNNIQLSKWAPQKSYVKNVGDIYNNYAGYLLDQGRFEEAQEVLDAYNDQKYFDLDSKEIKKTSPLTFTPHEADLSRRYVELSRKIAGLDRKLAELRRAFAGDTLTSEELTKTREAEEQLHSAENEFLYLLKGIDKEFEGPLDPTRDQVSGIEETRKMQEVFKKTGKKTIAIYTIPLWDNYRALIVTPTDTFSISIPIKHEELSKKVKQLWALLQSDEYDPKILSKEVYDLIFKPIKDKLIEEKKLEEVLPEGATILWSLEDDLRYLPMSALYDGEKYLIERYNNVVFTRVESERWLSKPDKNWTGLGFGESRASAIDQFPFNFLDLPNSIKELSMVFGSRESKSSLFEGEIFSNEKFTRENMISALQRLSYHPLVHITSHFYFAPGDETKSFLLLGNNKIFPLSEIKKYPDLFKGVELLTLSACETAAQRPNSDGWEIDGFAEMAQRQGANAVIATLWNVRDDSSYWLMRNFYEKMRNETDLGKGEALRQAQIALLAGDANVKRLSQIGLKKGMRGRGSSAIVKILPEGKGFPTDEEGVIWVEAKYAKPYDTRPSGRYAHPYFWSPFILFGNWQ